MFFGSIFTVSIADRIVKKLFPNNYNDGTYFLKIFFPSHAIQTGLAVLGAFLFSAFIVFDTQMIMKHLHAEEYIIGVINLYLDIINLFLEILKILDSMKRN